MKKMLPGLAVCFAMVTASVAYGQVNLSMYTPNTCQFWDAGNYGNGQVDLQAYPAYVPNETSQVFVWSGNNTSGWTIYNSAKHTYLASVGGFLTFSGSSGGDLFVTTTPNPSPVKDLTTGQYVEDPSSTAGAAIPMGSTAYAWDFSTSGSNSNFCTSGGVTTILANDSSILYGIGNPNTGVGGWEYLTNSQAYGGFQYSTDYTSGNPPNLGGVFQGMSVSVPFTGTGITWIGQQGPIFGKFTWSIDGGAETPGNTYNANWVQQANNLVVTGLANTSHVLRISLLNSTSGTDYYQTIEAFTITGTPLYLSSATVIGPCNNLPTFGTQWQGGCAQNGGDGSDGPAPAGHVYSGHPGDYIQWNFTGSLVMVVGRPDFEDGGLIATVDGVAVTLSMQAGTQDIDVFNRMVVFSKKLSPGPHTITLAPTGNGAGNSSEFIQISQIIAFQ
jgi:hypothetical protein